MCPVVNSLTTPVQWFGRWSCRRQRFLQSEENKGGWLKKKSDSHIWQWGHSEMRASLDNTNQVWEYVFGMHLGKFISHCVCVSVCLLPPFLSLSVWVDGCTHTCLYVFTCMFLFFNVSAHTVICVCVSILTLWFPLFCAGELAKSQKHMITYKNTLSTMTCYRIISKPNINIIN